MTLAVRAADLTKQYALYRRPIDRVVEKLTRRPRHVVFPALQGVTFDVDRGETLGIIGQNGAGKSTLLKLLCRVTLPTRGTLETTGTIASILELGTGFHPEFTGRDNAALNAAILGLTPAEVRERLPEILEFSELREFLDRPVKTYSSGMYMRLAFSVAVNVRPDILVIDEALAVGDGHFQKKCIDAIRRFQEQGRTILFCSHALYYISEICDRALWLDHGTVMSCGRSIDVVHEYENFLLQRDRSERAAEPSVPRAAATPVRITEVVVIDEQGVPRERFEQGEEIRLRVRLHAGAAESAMHLAIEVHRSADDLQCFSLSTLDDGLPPLSGRSDYELTVHLRDVALLRGEYDVVAQVTNESGVTPLGRLEMRPAFSMTGDRFEVGIVDVPHRWQVAHDAPLASGVSS